MDSLVTTGVVDVDLNDVLSSLGMENAVDNGTVVQSVSNNTIIRREEDWASEVLEEATQEIEDATPLQEAEEAFQEALDEVAPIVNNNYHETLIGLLLTNNKSLEFDESTARFSGATWYKKIQQKTVTLAGLGGIGSWTCMILSRMHPQYMYLYDDDTVDTVNMAGQLYGKSMIGKKKASAMANLLTDFSNYYGATAIDDRYTEESTATDIMICGFDNMLARRIFFNRWLDHVLKSNNPENCLFIDGRLAFSDMQVFCLTGDDVFNIKRYSDEYLFTDDEAEETICSMKQTTYCASMIGSIIVNLFTNFVANQVVPMMHSLPFKTYYDANIMYFKTEN